MNVQAFDGYVKGLLRRRYPPEMMVELQTAFGGALADLADAFPENTYCQTSNLQRFLKVICTVDLKLVSFAGTLSPVCWLLLELLWSRPALL